MATATPFIAIEDSGQDLAQKTVCLKVHFGLVGNSRKVSNSQVEVDADQKLSFTHSLCRQEIPLSGSRGLSLWLQSFRYASILRELS